MSTTHTPGPWLVTGTTVYALDETGERNRFCAPVQPGFFSTDGDRTPDDELLANARLISAAPDLLEALEEMLAVAPSRAPAAGVIVGIEDRHANAILKARAAIAKAKGEA